MIDDFRDHRLDELAGLVRTRGISAEELIGLALQSIEELNTPLDAWAALDSERARSRRTSGTSPQALVYLNRTSDLLFILARVANVATAHEEPLWRPGA